jgi:hypothetical protein
VRRYVTSTGLAQGACWGAVAGTLLLLIPRLAHAAEDAAKSPQWYEVAAGILAIPAAVLGLAYSYILIKKTRLEARKTELEIREKEGRLGELSVEEKKVATEIIEPLVADRVWKYIILRFALMYISLKLWSIVSSLYNTVLGGAALGAQQILDVNIDDESWVIWILFPLLKLPDLVTWLIIIGIGWPLFRDINSYLNINVKKFLKPWQN